MKDDLLKLLKEYQQACHDRSDELRVDDEDARLGVSVSFEGFIDYLETGKVE